MNPRYRAPDLAVIAPECDPLSLVILRAARRDVDTVMVGGEVVFRDGQPTRFDLEAAGREFAERMARTAFPAENAETVRRLIPHMRTWYGTWEVPRSRPCITYNSRI